METYYGHVRTSADALILLEACRTGLLPRVQRRWSEKERQLIRSGSVFVWDEREAGMRRWTDGKSWSASRVSGSFLTYREMEGKRGGNISRMSVSKAGKTPESTQDTDADHADRVGDEGPDGYQYKPNGLVKQSFSTTTSSGQHFHLISYYTRSHPFAANLQQPTIDPTLRHVRPQKSFYPKSTADDQQNLPMASPRSIAGVVAGPIIPRPIPSYAWPPTPLTTPPTVAVTPYGVPFYVHPVFSAAHAPGPPSYEHQQCKSLPRPAFQAHVLPPSPHCIQYERPYSESGLPAAGWPAAGPPVYPDSSSHLVPEISPQQIRPRDIGPVATDSHLASPRVPLIASIPPHGVVSGTPHLLKQTVLVAPQHAGLMGTLPEPTETARRVPFIGQLMNGTSPTPVTSLIVKTGESGSRPGDRTPTGGEGPRDIPHEKISLDGEDIRALRRLNRVFI
ncbi:hypothetical protein PENANT_c047G05011 [Penicillium antarcticum]|uniref:cAMP-independent regulatory protein pac2 n=1 Tax=Penicillium antarcticum TaxID=416450 RepID=A0A1V6PRE7_9EURO|nr:uncharacterized protein N7508_005058 [Penicillium antarcticum]KAJ5306043.1 hypothetical protein N7508_005058 [Penicillium antarcticum]OQD79584.1 hypothetical protein PENANT_c047G05011 [Penicillium antarcticum]